MSRIHLSRKRMPYSVQTYKEVFAKLSECSSRTDAHQSQKNCVHLAQIAGVWDEWAEKLWGTDPWFWASCTDEEIRDTVATVTSRSDVQEQIGGLMLYLKKKGSWDEHLDLIPSKKKSFSESAEELEALAKSHKSYPEFFKDVTKDTGRIPNKFRYVIQNKYGSISKFAKAIWGEYKRPRRTKYSKDKVLVAVKDAASRGLSRTQLNVESSMIYRKAREFGFLDIYIPSKKPRGGEK